MCCWNTVRESSHISFFCGRDPFCEVVRGPENKHGELTGLLEWPAGLSLRLRDQRTTPLRLSGKCISAFSPKLLTLYCLFKPHAKYEYPLRHVFFLFMASHQNFHTSVFFSVVCWSYLWTKITVTLSISNKLYSHHHLLLFSFLRNRFVDVILRPHSIC